MNSKEIKELRLNLDLSQQAFAVKLGVSLGTVNRWETKDFKPSPLALERLNKLQRKYNKRFCEVDRVTLDNLKGSL